MRLFAELRERGEDGAEVHSALVAAFCRWAGGRANGAEGHTLAGGPFGPPRLPRPVSLDSIPPQYRPTEPCPCRSGQPDVALDAFRHMRGLGLAATPAALHALLEVHVGRSAWEEADALLAAAADDGGDVLDAGVRRRRLAWQTWGGRACRGLAC